ncbi:FecR/PupR family sigma factor regulator [Pseudoxanthomonas beigongshangi]
MSATQESPNPAPSGQALSWYVRLHSGAPMDDAEQERFLAWLETPTHQVAWEEMLQLSAQLEQPARRLADESGHTSNRSASAALKPWWMAGIALLLSGVTLYYLFH